MKKSLLLVLLVGLLTQFGFAQEVLDFNAANLTSARNGDFPEIAGDLTVELFLNVDNPTAFPVVWKFGEGGVYNTSLWINSGAVEFWDNGSPLTASNSNAISTCQWHHVAYVWSNDTGTIYVDGDSVAAHIGRTNAPMGLFRLGNNDDDNSGNAWAFDGQMEEVRISNVARYTENFTVPVQEFIPDANTVALYRFKESMGQSTQDFSGNDLNLMLGTTDTTSMDDPVFVISDEASCAGAKPVSGLDVTDIVINSDVHNTLEAALGAAGLVETLQGDGPFTVFAPTDAAFAAIDSATLATLLADPTGDLTDILLYHVVGAKALSTDLSDGQEVMTINGKNVTVMISGDSVFINNALVTGKDIETDNGVVHVIDAVLLPPRITVADIVINSEDHNTLEAALGAAGLVETLQGDGPFTVFAPTDAAFAAIDSTTLATLLADPTGDLTDILLYHVVGAKALSTDLSDGQEVMTINGKNITVTISGDSVFINNALVTGKDIETDNGVVHVIDAVLLPPRITVADIVINSEDHNTLEAALGAAGLVETLQGDGPFTVFAPTDAAFAAIDSTTLATLLADPTGDLTDILLYHVVGAKALSTDLSDGQEVMTINGKNITVTISGDSVFINNALVTGKDIETDNGVVHVIDAVLLPPRITVADIVINSEDHNTLEAALGAAGLVETLQGDGPFTVFAPTDAAFAAIDSTTLATLLADPMGDLTDILLYHVVGAKALSTELSDGQEVMTINGKNITVTISGDSVFINNALVTGKDIETDNGVVHVIDAVLLPPRITVADIVINSEDHNTLEAALGAAGLVETLQGDGPFTVFAPTDAAFAAIDSTTLATLLADPMGDLTKILLYHVVDAKALSTDLSDGQDIITLNGQSVRVTISNDSVFINNALVTGKDIETDNGVVHVINAVLLPDLTNVTSIPTSGLDIQVFPNPTSDVLNINLNDISIDNANMILWDLNGRQVRLQTLDRGIHNINVSNLTPGMYYLELRVGTQRVQQPIVIKR